MFSLCIYQLCKRISNLYNICISHTTWLFTKSPLILLYRVTSQEHARWTSNPRKVHARVNRSKCSFYRIFTRTPPLTSTSCSWQKVGNFSLAELFHPPTFSNSRVTGSVVKLALTITITTKQRNKKPNVHLEVLHNINSFLKAIY